MDKQHVSHDILNILERLRIMHDLIRDQNYQHIPKDEILEDLRTNMELLKENFALLTQ